MNPWTWQTKFALTVVSDKRTTTVWGKLEKQTKKEESEENTFDSDFGLEETPPEISPWLYTTSDTVSMQISGTTSSKNTCGERDASAFEFLEAIAGEGLSALIRVGHQ